MGSPGHQSPQYQSGMQQMRPPSGGGQVTSPATDRPGNTPSPRTPGGSQPPSQPHTPDGQQFAQPSPQHIPQHHMQQQQPQYMMQQQQQQQQQQLHQQQQQQHGGGPGQGPVPHHVDDLAPQPAVRMRGGWGPFIGLKGGRPMDSNPPSSTSGGPPGPPPGGMQMPMAVVTTAPLMNNVPRPQGQQQGGPQQGQTIVGTTTGNISVSSMASNLTSGGFTQVRPLQVTSTAIRGQVPMGMRPQGGTPTMGTPGRPMGFNPRQTMNFQRTPYSSQQTGQNPNTYTGNGPRPQLPVSTQAFQSVGAASTANSDTKSISINSTGVPAPSSGQNVLSSTTTVMPTTALQGSVVPSLGVTITSAGSGPGIITPGAVGSGPLPPGGIAKTSAEQQQQSNVLLKSLLSGSNSSTTSTTTTTSATTTEVSSSTLEAGGPQGPGGLNPGQPLLAQQGQPRMQVSTQPQIQIQPPGGPIGQQPAGSGPTPPTRLNLPTVPVPEAALSQQRPTLVSGQPNMAGRPTVPQQGPQGQARPMNAIAQQGQMVMTRPRMGGPQFRQRTPSPGPQMGMRPMMITANGGQQVQQQQPQPGQPGGQQQQSGQHPSQLQGLLQQQILVPQNQLNQPNPAGGVVVSSQPSGQPGVQQPGVVTSQTGPQGQPQYNVGQPQQIRGPVPNPRMLAMMQQNQRGPMMQGGPQPQGPGGPQQGPPGQPMQVIQQQRFRLQQFRGPMPGSGANGEPLRPHFPPQQPMQVMRMPIPGGPGGHPMQMQTGPNGPPGAPGGPPGSMPGGPPGMMTGQPPQPHPMQSMRQMRPP